MLLLSVLLWCLAAAFEAAAVTVFMQGGDKFALCIALHIAFALTQTAATWLLLPRRYQNPAGWVLTYLFGVSLCIPVLSWFGLLFAFLPGLRWPRGQAVQDWQRHAALSLPFKAIRVDARAVQRRGGLTAVLMRDEADWRVRAVMATRFLSDRHAVPILRVALKDSLDEVRLLAYSLLSSKERRIDIAIERLDATPTPDSAAAARNDEEVAGLYLEQAELGLAEGVVRSHALERALKRIELALKKVPTAQRKFLQGRICLRMGHIGDADAAFEAAVRLGFDLNKVAPYRAECAFERGDYATLRAQLGELAPQTRNASLLAPVVEYWL